MASRLADSRVPFGRMRLRSWCALVLTLVIAFTVGVEGASACSCGGYFVPAPVLPGQQGQPEADQRAGWARRLLASADAAFVGRLLEVRPVSRRRDELRADFRYRIDRLYKGRRLRGRRSVTVRSLSDEAACGLPDRVGRRYGLLLHKRKRRSGWSSGLCSLMRPRDMRLGAGTRASMRVAPPAGATSCT